MDVYKLLKINRMIGFPFVKSLGIWLLHVLNKRYYGIFFDPVLACNLRCKMCYFSNEEKRKTYKGIFNKDDLNRLAEVVFPQAMKLQIGCGAEPTLYKHNADIIRLGKQYNIPYISLTTNANLLTDDEINNLLRAGLDEFTISLHGVKKETYEDLMQGASYEKFIAVLQCISDVKRNYPDSKLRINYTVNEQNLKELADFFNVFDLIKIDVLQIRPLQNLEGDIRLISDRESFYDTFNEIIAAVRTECKNRNITLVAPLKLDISSKKNKSSSDFAQTYCYISPRSFWHNDMNWQTETFRQYAKRTKYSMFLFGQIFKRKKLTDNMLNYDIN